MPDSLAERLRVALIGLTPNQPGAVDALRPLYSEAMVFRDPLQEVRGLEAFVAMNRRLLSRMRVLTWQVDIAQEASDVVFLEWTMRGKPALGPSIEVSGVTRARAERGLIVDHRDYWDLGELVASGVPGGKRLLMLLRSPLA